MFEFNTEKEAAFKKLLEYDRKLREISRNIEFTAVNPSNFDAEKKKFFSSSSYEPVFSYKSYHISLNILRKKLEKISPDNSVVGKILKDIKKECLLNIDMLEKRGKESFTKASLKLYGAPDDYLVRKAREFLKLETKKEKKIYSTKQIIKKIKTAFLKYGVNWKVEEKDILSMAAVSNGRKRLVIKKNSRFSKSFLKRIVVHEIGTHILRYENGSMQPFLFFSSGLPGYLMTEEGLAVINEEKHNCLNNYILKVYAGRVLAIHYSLRKPFREVFNILSNYFSEAAAFRITVRAKRGISDTSKPGGCTKDIAYLKGYLAIKNYLNKGGDIYKLYYGKIGLQHIGLLDKIPFLVHPMFLPMFRYSNFIFEHFSEFFNGRVLSNMPLFSYLKRKKPA